jgi:lipopolysaccharide export system permease protein
VLIFLYYLLLTAGEALAEKGRLPAVVALWIPNAVFIALGATLFAAAAHERRLNVFASWSQRWIAHRAAGHAATGP